MRHLSEGTLRRLADEPQATAVEERLHLKTCAACRAALGAVERDAARVAEWLAVPSVAVNTAFALCQVKWRALAEDHRPAPIKERVQSMFSRQTNRLLRPLVGGAGIVAVAGALAFTPAGAWAGSFLTVFEPTHVTAVTLDPNDLKSLPELANYGTVKMPAKTPAQHFTDGQAAASAANLTLLTPATLPAGVPNTPNYEVIPGTTGSFTFSAAKAKAAAAVQNKQLPPMPANLNGATLQVSTSAALVELYANPNTVKSAANTADGAAKSQGTNGSSQNLSAAAAAAGPLLIIGEMPAPSVTTSGNGVTVQELEQYLLSQPGISPNLANAIRAIGAPSTTLPIPIPVNQAVSRNVTLKDGTPAVVVGDSTGLLGGIIWEKGGVVYGVAGSLTQQQAIDMANGFVS